MYKSIIIMCLQTVYNDTRRGPWISVDLQSEYLTKIEKSGGDYDLVFSLLEGLLVEGEVLPKPVLSKDLEGHDLEFQRLVLIIALIQVTVQTDLLRKSISSNDTKESQSNLDLEIARANDVHAKTLAKTRAAYKEVTFGKRPVGQSKAEYVKLVADIENQEKLAECRRMKKISYARRVHFFNIRRQESRQTPLGTDIYGNTYWHFQQRSVDVYEWGWWITVEKSTLMADSLQQLEQPAGNKGRSVEPTTAKRENHGGVGELHYLPITASSVDDLIKWLQYQKEAFREERKRNPKPGMWHDDPAVTSLDRVISYLKLEIKEMCLEEDEDNKHVKE